MGSLLTDPLANAVSGLQFGDGGLELGEWAILDGVRVVAVGTAQGTCVPSQDGAQYSPIGTFEDVGGVEGDRLVVVPAEHAYLQLRLGPGASLVVTSCLVVVVVVMLVVVVMRVREL